MSWDVELKHKGGKVVSVTRHSEGGTYAMGGTPEAELNVTYNYSGHFFDALGYNFQDLNGRKAADAVADLERAVKTLGTERDENYWKPTKGNAGYALSILLGWAKQYPSAIFEVN